MKLTLPFMVRRIAGVSMVPTLRPGWIIIGFRWARKYEAEQVVVAERNGRELVKRIEAIDENSVRLVGDNPVHSTDSRQYGELPRSALLARVLFVPGVRNRS